MQALEHFRYWPSRLSQCLAHVMRGLVVIVSIVTLPACNSKEVEIWSLSQEAAFDPNIAAQPGGVMDFQTLPASTIPPDTYAITRSWSEQDFFELTRAFDASRHRQTPSNLRIRMLSLTQDCTPAGALPGHFSMYWFAPLPATGNRIDGVYIVTLRKGFLYWSEGEKNPDSENYKPLVTYSPGVTYAQALAAAEAAGGTAFRAKVGNNCSIRATRNSGIEQGHWRVSYVAQDWFLEVVVHAGTGSILSSKEGARSR